MRTNEPKFVISEEEPVKRSVRLLRVSSKSQTDTDADVDPDGNSIDTQRKVAIAKEKALGTVNVGEYVEPGYSGQLIQKRPFFKKLLQRIRSKHSRPPVYGRCEVTAGDGRLRLRLGCGRGVVAAFGGGSGDDLVA